MTIIASRITANAVTLAERFPSSVETHANQGGVLIAGDDDCTKPTSGCVRATIRNTSVSDVGVARSQRLSKCSAGQPTGLNDPRAQTSIGFRCNPGQSSA